MKVLWRQREHRPGWSRALAALIVGGLVLALGGCFENPVRRVLSLSFEADGDLEIGLRIDLLREDFASGAVKERLAEEERKLLSPEDPWRRRFAAMTARTEDMSQRRREGLLTRMTRRAEIEHRALQLEDGPLAAFWQGTSIFPTYTYDRVARVAELSLFPGKAQQAGYREQRLVEEKIDMWAELIFRYLQDIDALYTYLERYPERAEPIFASFGEHGDEAQLSEEEAVWAEALSETMFQVLAPFETVDEQDGETWDEMSRRVFDPFAARIVVDVPGRPLESEGFVEQGGRLVIPGLSLWTAWQELSDAWVSPNLLMILVDVEQEFGGLGSADNGEPTAMEVEVDFSRLAAEPRRTDMPFDAAEVGEAIRSWLRPAPVYRVRWHVQDGDQDSPS